MAEHVQSVRASEAKSSLDRQHVVVPKDPPIARQLNARSASVTQRATAETLSAARANRTGLPDGLKAGVEALSGIALDDVRVHRNSSEPAQMQAHAFAQGTDIHLAPGQEQHLPHEAWHVVQQKQGRVRATMQLKGGVPVNDDAGLEAEADMMGAHAVSLGQRSGESVGAPDELAQRTVPHAVAQRIVIKVTTKRIDPNTRVINKIAFADRVPTTVSGSQGDHTVAEALVQLALTQRCVGQTHLQVAAELTGMLLLIDSEIGVTAKYLGDDGKFQVASIGGIRSLIEAYHQQALNGADGEDLNEQLSFILEMYLRVWNKRLGAAYLRSEGNTQGEKGEKAAKKSILDIAHIDDLDEVEEDEEGPDWRETLGEAIVKMVDYKPKNLQEAAEHVWMAIELVLQSVPKAEFHYNDVGTLAVELYCKKHGFDKQTETMLDKLIFEKLNGGEMSESDDSDDGSMKPMSTSQNNNDGGGGSSSSSGSGFFGGSGFSFASNK